MREKIPTWGRIVCYSRIRATAIHEVQGIRPYVLITDLWSFRNLPQRDQKDRTHLSGIPIRRHNHLCIKHHQSV